LDEVGGELGEEREQALAKPFAYLHVENLLECDLVVFSYTR
jgi:hypothetical protein